jgi:dipeptidyl-peptidase 4
MHRLTLFLALSLSLFAQKKPVTLETLNQGGRGGRGGGGPANWAPDGKTFVFRQRQSLMIYNPATKTSRELVSTEAIDAAAVHPPAETGPFDWTNRRARVSGGIQWSDDGKAILYESSGDLFLIHTDTGKWDQITKTPEIELDPQLSPDAKMVAFRRGYDLYSIDLATQKETRLTRGGTPTLINGGLDWVYPEELDLSTAFWWSPDSKSIAYLQFDSSREPLYPHEDVLGLRAVYEPERYPQAGEDNADVHFGIVPSAGGPTRWLEVGDTRFSYLIARAGWMPDSRNVYVIRTNRIQNKLEMFSINVESGMPATIFKESDPYWINLHGDVRFLADGKRFLWQSERDTGFNHIFLYSNDGREVKPLTKGPWEVKSIAGVTPDRVYYTSDEGDSLETHLFSIKLDGGDKRRLDKTPGMHNVSMGPGGSYYLDTHSSLTEPPSTTLHSADGAELGVYRPADRRQLDEYEMLPTEVVTFKTPEGITLHGRLIKPAGFDPTKKYPAIVSVYGGPGVGLPVHNSWPGVVNVDQVYAQHGYVVWQSENRGGMGRGHAFETPIFRQMGVVELADQVEGVKYLISLGYVDAAKVGIHGWSYGGFMTLNAVFNAPNVFKCGIAGAPVTSWMNYDTIYTERYMGLPSENREAYATAALPPKAKNLSAKLMIVHNFEDDNVLFQNTMQVINALELEGKQFEFMLYPQKSHGVGGVAARQMNQSMLDFFDRNLK